MKKWMMIVLLVVAGHRALSQTWPEYCNRDAYGRFVSYNAWHCNMPDERHPRERVLMETETQELVDDIPTRPLPIGVEWIGGQWMPIRDFYSGFLIYGGPESAIPAVSASSSNYRQGGDAELAALGPVVQVGEMIMTHICIAGQKYISTVALRQDVVTMTFTCAKDELHLLGPVVKHTVVKGTMMPYSGGPTWDNVKR